MRKYCLIIFSLLFPLSVINAQTSVSFNLGCGLYLINSENSMKITENKNFQSYLFYDLSYTQEKLLDINLMFEYNYHKSIKKNALVIPSMDDTGNNVGEIGGDLILINQNFDLDYWHNINKHLFYGFGPSLVITNRIIDIENSLYDKLASFGLGMNGFLSITIPINEGKSNFFLTSKLKLRYTHSIWFDEGIRKLDNYYQEFFTTQFSAGVGYHFSCPSQDRLETEAKKILLKQSDRSISQ